MRKRHQAILISSHAKKNICNDISLNLDSYENEQKYILNKYFKENINPEDINPLLKKEKSPENVEDEEENEDLEDNSDSEEDYISINSNIKVPHLGAQKGPYIKYEISEKALIGGIDYNDYTIIPNNKIKINSEVCQDNNDTKRYNKYSTKKENNEVKKERIINIGEKIEFKNILEQMAYWAEQLSLDNLKDKNKNKRKIKEVEIPDINILQLFKLYPKKIEDINNKIKELEKEMKDKNLHNDNCVIKTILTEQEKILNEKMQSINKLSKELDNIENITYGDKFSLIKFK